MQIRGGRGGLRGGAARTLEDVAQDAAAMQRLAATLRGMDAWKLAGMQPLVTIAGSLVIALALAVLVTAIGGLRSAANAVTAVGLTIPSFALLGLVIPLVGIGIMPSVIAVTFYAILPILRNAVVGLDGVNPTLVESARGMGLSPIATSSSSGASAASCSRSVPNMNTTR